MKSLAIQVHYTTFHTNQYFFEALKRLDVVAETPNFIEYKHRSLLQIYLRVPKYVLEKEGIAVYMFIEPQINLNKSIREGGARFKLQLTVVDGCGRDGEKWVSLKAIGNGWNKWETNDLLRYLGVCDAWHDRLYDVLTDQPELFEITTP